jgi:IS1 family transposase/transposase-like protein
MELSRCYCPNQQCSHYGLPGFGCHLVRRGYDGDIPRLKCNMCQSTFSARQGTAYFDIHTDERIYTIATRALAEGNSLRGTGRIVGIDKDTVCDWLDKSGRHCRAVTTYLFNNLHITECQLDELWSFVRKKEARLSALEKILMLYGDAWVWIAFAPEWRLVPAFVIGKRVQENADLLIERLKAVSCGFIPFFTSDQLAHYPNALLNGYGIPEVILDIPGKRGRKPKPKLLPPSNLLYAQVVKRRQRGRVVEITKKVIFGDETAIQTCLTASTTSRTINTSFVERNNLTCRQSNGRLSRKVLSFSKDLTWMEKHLWLSLAYYHFVLPHSSLAQLLPEPQLTRGSGSSKKLQPTTPAMKAGITDHVWTMEELLNYRVPPDFRDSLEQQPIVHNLQAFHTRS